MNAQNKDCLNVKLQLLKNISMHIYFHQNIKSHVIVKAVVLIINMSSITQSLSQVSKDLNMV